MNTVFSRDRWRRQPPPGSYEIDRSTELGQNIRLCLVPLPGNRLIDLHRRDIWTPVGTVSTRYRGDSWGGALCAYFPGATDCYYTITRDAGELSGCVNGTLALIAARFGANDVNGSAILSDGSSNHRFDTSGNITLFNYGVTAGGGPFNQTNNTWVGVAAKENTNKRRFIYKNGQLVTDTNTVGDAVAFGTGTQTYYFGKLSGSSFYDLDADIPLLLYTTDEWSHGQANEFHTAPYSIFKKRVAKTFFLPTAPVVSNPVGIVPARRNRAEPKVAPVGPVRIDPSAPLAQNMFSYFLPRREDSDRGWIYSPGVRQTPSPFPTTIRTNFQFLAYGERAPFFGSTAASSDTVQAYVSRSSSQTGKQAITYAGRIYVGDVALGPRTLSFIYYARFGIANLGFLGLYITDTGKVQIKILENPPLAYVLDCTTDSAVPTTRPFDIAVTLVNNVVTVYIDGTIYPVTYANQQVLGINFYPLDRVLHFSTGAPANVPSIAHQWGAWWSTDLSPAALRSIALDPFQVFESTRPRLLIIPWSSALSLLSVDGDNTIYNGQTGIIILPNSGSSFAPSGNLVQIVQGGTTLSQTVTAESTSSITFTANLSGLTIPGTAVLKVGKPV